MAGKPVGRPRSGAVRKDESATAVRAYVAGRLAGRLDARFLREDLAVSVNTTAVKRAAGPLRWRPPGYTNPGSSPASARAAGSAAPIRDWLSIETRGLDLGTALVSFPVAGTQAQRELYRALSTVAGVVHVLAVGDGRDRRVVAVVLTDGEADRRRLRAELDEFGDSWQWDEVDHDTTGPAVATWRHLTRTAAAREDLLAG